MNWLHVSLLAKAPPGLLTPEDSGPGRVVYEFSRLREFDDLRLPIAAIAVVVVALCALVWHLYRRDTQELSRGVGLLLAGLRFVALAGLLVFFLGVERRTTREVIHNSQVAVLVDGSQSMALTDDAGTANASTDTRVDQVIEAINKTPLLNELRRHHDVNISRFDQDVQPVVTLPKDAGLPKEGETTTGIDSSVRMAADGTPESGDASTPPRPAVDWKVELAPEGTQSTLR